MERQPTEEQRRIIESTEGYQRVCAVPGSGKTFSIVNRMAYLVTKLYVDPSSIVAITFTNKAARNMTGRLKKMIGDEGECFTGTFHGYCNKILREDIHRLSYPAAFTILDKRDQIDLIRAVAGEQEISLKDITAGAYADKIAERKMDWGYVEEYMAGPDKSALLERIRLASGDEEVLFYHYLLKQRDNYALDFQDLMMFALCILQNCPDVLEKWQDRCQYLLCDEYQDVNGSQDFLLELLSGKFRNLTVVGDDDQCIYGWRGSKVDYMLNFDTRYPGASEFHLSRNFRCTPEIVAVANSLIAANQFRLEKKMYTENPSGPLPVYNHLKTEGLEALWIAETIQEAVGEGRKFSDHTVLVRASSQTRALEEAFVRRRIPYKILSGAQFYGSEEIRTVLSYLRLVYSLSDLDFEWTVGRPRRGFGKKSVEQLRAYARGRGITLMEALGERLEAGVIRKQALADYYERIMELHRVCHSLSSTAMVHKVLDCGYRKELQQDVDQVRLDNVSELIATIAGLEQENGEPIPLEDLLAHFALFASQDDDSEKDVVKIMTVHTAKGLEFDTVFICGMVEGLFPSKRLRNQDELEEERRLFYVAVTRAIHRLYISSYSYKADSMPAYPSSFLENLDASLFRCIGSSVIRSGVVSPGMLPRAQFREGDTVVHPTFGRGTVTRVDERNQTYDIQFESLPGAIRRILFRAELKAE